MFISAIFIDCNKFDWSVSRFISRMTGRLCNAYLPPYIRVLGYKAFGILYGVNFEELPEDSDLNDFKCFNEFFTRSIDMSKRPITDKEDFGTLCSPVDGRILSHGLIN